MCSGLDGTLSSRGLAYQVSSQARSAPSQMGQHLFSLTPGHGVPGPECHPGSCYLKCICGLCYSRVWCADQRHLGATPAELEPAFQKPQVLCKLAKGEAGSRFLLVGRSARGPVSKSRASSSEAGATDHTACRRLTHSFSGTIIASYLYGLSCTSFSSASVIESAKRQHLEFLQKNLHLRWAT